MEIIKWDINETHKKPKRIKHTKGGNKYFEINTINPQLNHHWQQINCIAFTRWEIYCYWWIRFSINYLVK